MNTYQEKAMCSLQAFYVKKALKGRRWNEKKQEKKRRKEIQHAKLHLKADRTKIMLKVFKTRETGKRRKLMQQVVAHRLINKVPSSCPAAMCNRIPARAKEEKEKADQMQHCEKIVEHSNVPRGEKKGVKKEGPFRRFINLFRRDKTSGSSKITNIFSKLLKKAPQQKGTGEKGKGKEEIEEKKLGMKGEQKMEETRTFTVEEEVEEKKKNERKVKAMRDRIQRVKLFEKMVDTEDPEEKRQLMQRVITHKMINKIGVPCAGKRRDSILARPTKQKEKETHQFQNIGTRSSSFREEEKEEEKEVQDQDEDETIVKKTTSKIFSKLLKKAPQQKGTGEKGKGKEEIEEKKLGMKGEQKMEETRTFTVEEEVEEKKKNERKVKAMRDRIQRVKLFEKMVDTEDPEEKRKLMQRVITHKMINKIGVPCAGKRRDSILARPTKQKEKETHHFQNIGTRSSSFREEEKEEEKEVQDQDEDETIVKKTTSKLTIMVMTQDSLERLLGDPKSMEHQDMPAHGMELLKQLFDTNGPLDKREIMHKMLAHKSINKVPSPCSPEMHFKIPSRAMEQEEDEIQPFQNIFDFSNSFSERESEVQDENLFEDKTSDRKITNIISDLLKQASQQIEKVKEEVEEKKLGKEKKKTEKETSAFTEEEKRKVEEEVEEKKKNERKVKAMRDRIQRVKLFEKMSDTEDPEEKRKLMQRMITHKMINKIGVPCAGKKQDSVHSDSKKSRRRHKRT